MLVDFNDPIEKVLFYEEGESPATPQFNDLSGKDPKHLCCKDCKGPHIVKRLNPESHKKNKVEFWCNRCEAFTGASKIGPIGPHVTASRNSGRSAPPVSERMKIAGGHSLDGSPRLWLHFGHGAKYASDMEEEFRAWNIITEDAFRRVESENPELCKTCEEKGVSVFSASKLIIGMARRGNKSSKYAVSKHFNVSNDIRCIAHLYNGIRRIIEEWDDNICQYAETL